MSEEKFLCVQNYKHATVRLFEVVADKFNTVVEILYRNELLLKCAVINLLTSTAGFAKFF
jgi:hypothetical protein